MALQKPLYAFNPDDLLDLYNSYNDKITCVGYARSERRRCRNPIASANISEAKMYCHKLSQGIDDYPACRATLMSIAALLLCLHDHQNQKSTVVQEWHGLVQQNAARVYQENENALAQYDKRMQQEFEEALQDEAAFAEQMKSHATKREPFADDDSGYQTGLLDDDSIVIPTQKANDLSNHAPDSQDGDACASEGGLDDTQDDGSTYTDDDDDWEDYHSDDDIDGDASPEEAVSHQRSSCEDNKSCHDRVSEVLHEAVSCAASTVQQLPPQGTTEIDLARNDRVRSTDIDGEVSHTCRSCEACRASPLVSQIVSPPITDHGVTIIITTTDQNPVRVVVSSCKACSGEQLIKPSTASQWSLRRVLGLVKPYDADRAAAQFEAKQRLGRLLNDWDVVSRQALSVILMLVVFDVLARIR